MALTPHSVYFAVEFYFAKSHLTLKRTTNQRIKTIDLALAR